MDRLQKLTDHLPSGITQNLQNIPGLSKKREAQESGKAQQTPQYPPADWSQTSTPVVTPGSGPTGAAPGFPVALPYNTPTQNQNQNQHQHQNAQPYGITEKPAHTFQDPYPTPGSAKTATLLAPAPPVARPRRWTPLVLRPIIVYPFILLLAVLAVAIEVLYFFNKKSNGFYVDPGFKAISLVISFIPVLLALGLVTYITQANDEIMRLQPYINASHGNADAKQTVLLDYPSLGKVFLVMRSFQLKNYLVALSGGIVLAAALFQPIIAAIFVVRSTKFMMPQTTTTSSAVMGLRPDFNDLNNFVAAAGYAEAALIHGLDDPPFVCGGWSVAPFEFQWMLDEVARNGTASVQTYATLIDPRCSLGDSITEAASGNSWTSSFAGWGSNCSATFSIDASSSTDSNFGVVRVDNCPLNGTVPDDPFKPIMFWFYGPSGQSSTAWCSPTVVAFHALANMTLFNNTIGEVEPISQVANTNITAGYTNLALNGVFFTNTTNKFVAARATAIQSTIPGSIFRAAENKANGNANAIFNNLPQLLDITTGFYTQYLATAGQSNFFIPTEFEAPAQIEAWQPRLWMNSLATHGFAALFLLIAILMFVLHTLHRKERQRLFLAGPPGSIASAVSLTSSARFGALLNAGDNPASLGAKLEGMKFGIDRETWQIIVEKDGRQEEDGYGNGYVNGNGNGNGNGSRNGSDETKGNKHTSMSASVMPRRESVVGTMLHPVLGISPPGTPGFNNPGAGFVPSSPGGRVDVVGTVASPTSATFMIPPQPSGYQAPLSPPPPSPGYPRAH